MRPLEADFNHALASPLPRWFQRQLQHKGVHLAIDLLAIDLLAIDLPDVPYYGKADQQHHQTDHWVCRGEAQAGTDPEGAPLLSLRHRLCDAA